MLPKLVLEGSQVEWNVRAGGWKMKKVLTVAITIAATLSVSSLADAQMQCPSEVSQARRALSTQLSAARDQDVQAPRGQDVQAPRGQEVQAPRGQDVQAPRGQDLQAPRGQEIQAPRTPSPESISRASRLMAEAESACAAGEHRTAKEKASEVLAILRSENEP